MTTFVKFNNITIRIRMNYRTGKLLMKAQKDKWHLFLRGHHTQKNST